MSELIDKYFNVRVQLRNDDYSNWEKQKDFIPKEGEIIIYNIPTKARDKRIAEASFQLIKIGDGIKPLKDLPFINSLEPNKITITHNNEKGEYIFLQGGKSIGEINILKDTFIKSGNLVIVKLNEQGKKIMVSSPDNTIISEENIELEEGRYIRLVFLNKEEPIYINVEDLVDDIYQGIVSDTIEVKVDNKEHKIEANLKDIYIGSEEEYIKTNIIDDIIDGQKIRKITALLVTEKIEKLINEYLESKRDEEGNVYFIAEAKIAETGSIYDIIENNYKDENNNIVQQYIILDCN